MEDGDHEDGDHGAHAGRVKVGMVENVSGRLGIGGNLHVLGFK